MCKPKTMVKIGAVVVGVLAVAWFALPGARATVIALAPFALFAICPLAMLIGVGGMHRMGRGETKQHADCCAGNAGSSARKEHETEK